MAKRKSNTSAGDKSRHLAIEGELTIYTATENKPRLLAALKPPATEFDLSGVTEIDAAGLQLLLLAKREARSSHIDLTFSGHSSAVIECLDLCDLGGIFGDPIVLANETF